jgi:apolipoprotein D and lipocalin family protein
MKILSAAILILILVSLGYLMFGKQGIPDGVTAVTPFDLKRFEGTWYEIARLDHGFEKNMSHVSFTYTLKDGGDFEVVNKSLDGKNGRWETSEGKGAFIGDPNVGRLKVSYFGPFYGSFNIIAMDEKNYSWAMATGPSTRYLWILSRNKTLEDPIIQDLIRKAIGMGFKLDKMVHVDQKDETAVEGLVPAKANSAK